MVSYVLTLLAAASSALAATPAGFTPASQNNLVVQYGGLAINGQVVQRNCACAPSPPPGARRHANRDRRGQPSSASRPSGSPAGRRGPRPSRCS